MALDYVFTSSLQWFAYEITNELEDIVLINFFFFSHRHFQLVFYVKASEVYLGYEGRLFSLASLESISFFL